MHGTDSAFCSVLFAEAVPEVAAAPEPACFGDLNLDAVLATLARHARGADVQPLFRTPLGSAEDVRHRQDVCRTLERDDVRDGVVAFCETMDDVRRRLALVAQLRDELGRQGWTLEAMAGYCGAVKSLRDALADADPPARGLRDLLAHLQWHASSAGFVALENGTTTVGSALRAVAYEVHVEGASVRVGEPGDEPDLGAAVEETFARFRDGGPWDHRITVTDSPALNHVEARILQLVAEQRPELFRRLAAHVAAHPDFVEPGVGRFDREIRFLLAYLDMIAPLRAAGLAFTYPEVSEQGDLAAEAVFDLALANALAGTGAEVVPNDVRLSGDERVIVVSGPNNGGKTTFARAFGQLHHLAALGLPVPGRCARVPLADAVFTHFARPEAPELERGRLDDDLIRVRGILNAATPGSVVVMNESFSSTSLDDAREVGAAVLRRILELGASGVYVTFIDELAAIDDAIVSMVGQVDADDPARRTFRVVRARADGRAYAAALARRHGLDYAHLVDRIGA